MPGKKPVKLPAQSDPSFPSAYLEAISLLEDTDVSRNYPPRSLSALIEEWYRSPEFRSLGETTQITYRRILEYMREQPYAQFNVLKFTPRHIRMIIAQRADTPARANHILRLFKMTFAYAIDLGWRDDDPSFGVKRLKTKDKEIETWSEAHIEQFESFWPVGTRERLAFDLLLYTGQRRSDIVTLGPQSIVNGRICLTQIKTKTYIEIPIHERLRMSLDATAPHAETFIRTIKGQPSSSNGFYNQFIKWCEQASIPKGLSPHGLRKAIARRLAEAGCTPHQIGAITGHETLKEVDRYTRAANKTHLADEGMQALSKKRSF
ncbi:site-specific integrase [Acetobacter sp.]|uniref:site-specific integrase n=1 Tax=Acetobacter sp. TaxID=440 RepID=UPI0039ECB2B7